MTKNNLGKLQLLIVLCQSIGVTFSTEAQCHLDCKSSPRPVGPTRPWDAVDPIGNPLHLTRPYPYFIAASDVDENRYALYTFCQLGCTYFYRESRSYEEKTTLSRCYVHCDEEYSYNSSTPPYNDLAAVALLECYDGCLMALMRCQPGYYCLPLSLSAGNNASAAHFDGGDMIPCPAGTFRDVSYESVTECTQCPPNHYREDIKGRSVSGCSPCPAGTSAVNPGSTSIKDCLRCPAGTFSTLASFCICITPKSCAQEHLLSPAGP